MSVQVETLEHNMAKLTVEVSAADLNKEIQNVYNRQKGQINIPGFRKGKAPRKLIEQMYGKGVFMEDAINNMIPAQYGQAAQESGLVIVSQPQIALVSASPEEGFTFTAEVAVKPEVTLGEYMGLEVTKTEIEVTEEEIEAELKKEQEKNARTLTIDDRAAQMDDIVTLDFEGFVDGVAFEGGKGTDYPLTLGSNSFIPGFEDQLVGASTGDHVEVKVTFPEDYQAENLQGADAIFQCDIKKIEAKELPALDDDFAQDVSEFDTLEEYKADIRSTIEERKEKEAVTNKENEVVDKAIENAQMDIPQPMIEYQIDLMVEEFSNSLRSQGMQLDQYMQFTGMTMDSMREIYKPQAEKRIKTRLVLEKVVEAENIQASDEDVEAELDRMAEAYKMEKDKIREMMGEGQIEQMKDDLAVQKAVTLMTESAKEA